ncbi:hypothetical protein PR202_gb02437 [Eleusine coracana subsp. coracana]|uniref:F-box/LRR-repeat protein 15/At3g58940/PEG3-like LRR domain-containing protein n=1 Tax=Eleusine coracana subsp. coracana TaxID=191504 RepID=A0AAV5DZ60_ELECO|nr:hypothetical protein PR202_gb02437 [Eleusine coracana subsp. coracana]
MDMDVIIDNNVARITAPRLEVIGISYFRNAAPRPEYDIHDLISVRRLENLQLDMHGKYCHDTDQVLGLWFLARCPGVEHVDVKLEHHCASHIPDKSDLVDLTKEGGKQAAQFANVKSMFVTAISGFPARHLVSSVASLLIRCSRHLRLLRLRVPVITPPRDIAKCFCEDLEDKWEIPGKIALEQLQDLTPVSTRPGRATMDPRVGHRDRISALPDELLHVILSFLGDAPEVTRTAVLSRRWRLVWVHASNLEFSDHLLTKNCTMDNPGHFAGFVDWVLAQRGNADMESLSIHILQKKGRVSSERLNEWLRYTAQHVVKSVKINLLGWVDEQAIELPSHGRATSLSLDLATRRLKLPDAFTARYEALTELKLWSVSFREEIPGHTLSDFLTSCCPRLRRLQIGGAKGLVKLVFRADALEDLYIFYNPDQQMVDVTAPNLRAVHINSAFRISHVNNEVVRIMAPKLEEIGGYLIDDWRGVLDINGLTSVRRFNMLSLFMHGKYYRDGDASFSLLENCPGVQHLDVLLKHRFITSLMNGNKLVDLASEGKPPLANVRTMVVRAPKLPEHHLLAGVSSLLMRCPHLTSLVIDLCITGQIIWECFCEAFTDRFTIFGKLALESLQEVKITGFTGTTEEMQLVSLLLESSNSIKCLALSETKRNIDIVSMIQKIEKEMDADNSSTIGQKLLEIPCADRGRWYFLEKCTRRWIAKTAISTGSVPSQTTCCTSSSAALDPRPPYHKLSCSPGDGGTCDLLFKEKGHASPEKVNEWLRYAARRVVGSVDIDLGPLLNELDHHQAVVELPIHGGRATSISLSLSNHRLRLPAATSAMYEALTDLTLYSLWFADDGMSTLLGDFVMSCCPRLRRLIISCVRGLTQLVLDTEVLEELYISYTDGLQKLDVVAPNLRVITLGFFHISLISRDINLDNMMIRIVAPRLEEFRGDDFPYRLLPVLDIRGLESVRRLKNLELDTHGKYHRTSDLWLLQNCPAAQHVHVNLCHSSTRFAADKLVDLTAPEAGNRLFPNVRAMSIMCGVPRHNLVASISSLLMKCPHLTSVNITGIYFPEERRGFKCSCEALLTDRCTVHGKLALESLQEVKITGFRGTDEEMQLARLLFGSSNSIQRLNIELRAPTKVEAGVKIFQELTTMKTPCADQEEWSFAKKQKGRRFNWTCNWTRL